MVTFDPDQFAQEVVQAAYRIELADALGEAREALSFPGRGRSVTVAPEEVERAKEDAKLLIKQPGVIERLCPALQSVSDDISDIAKGVVGAMIPLAMGPQAVIPLTSVAFGALAVVIFRMGIRSLCQEKSGTADEGSGRHTR